MNTVKKSAVLYHYPCPDGAFAALAAHLYFSSTSLPVLYFPNTVYDPIRSMSLLHLLFRLIDGEGYTLQLPIALHLPICAFSSSYC